MKENTLMDVEHSFPKEASPISCEKNGATANYEISQREILTNNHQRAAICIHVSVTEIDQKISLQRQLSECKEFIKLQGWTSSDIFLSTPKNNIFCLIRARAKSGAFDKIIDYANIDCESPFERSRILNFITVWDACNFVSREPLLTIRRLGEPE